MKEPLKIGDRVVVYGYAFVGGKNATWTYLSGIRGTVLKYICRARDEVQIKTDSGGVCEFHHEQCRRLKKKERRRVWISMHSLYKSGDHMPVFFEPQAGCREFIEVKKK